MRYETRRERRLRIENDRRAAMRRRLAAFTRTVAALTVFAVVTIFIGTRDQTGQITLFGPSEPSEIKQAATNQDGQAAAKSKELTAAEKVTQGLSGQIDQFNDELQIASRTGLADLPNRTAVGVATIDLANNGRGNVNYNATTQFTSASTYKIYVAYAMVNDVETGKRNWNSRLNGTTWETCLNRMIINSDNACPEAYIALYGYNSFNARIHNELGVSDQTQLAAYNMRTTAADLAMVLQKLYQGKLMTEDNKNRLFSLMQQQIYRQGIPAGVGQGVAVSDKVGFLDSLLHDAAIVHSAKGDYVMVIMTNGESWPFIAKVAGYINGLYSQ